MTTDHEAMRKRIQQAISEHPGWGALSASDLAQRIASALSQSPAPAAAAVPEVKRIHALEALHAIKATLVRENEAEPSAICDTIWHGPGETLFDFIDNSIVALESTPPAPAAAAVPETDSPLLALFTEALAWGMVYGPEIPPHQWDRVRDEKATDLVKRAAAPAAPAVEAGVERSGSGDWWSWHDRLHAAPAVGAARPTDDALWEQTLQERDDYHEWADQLAARIARITGVDIGEHSSANCPWQNAVDAADEFAAPHPSASGAQELTEAQ